FRSSISEGPVDRPSCTPRDLARIDPAVPEPPDGKQPGAWLRNRGWIGRPQPAPAPAREPASGRSRIDPHRPAVHAPPELRRVPTRVQEAVGDRMPQDRKSTRLNSSHVKISYAV